MSDAAELDKTHEWDFIVAGWPLEVREADKDLSDLEAELEDMLEVSIQQTVSRCKRYSREHGYHFTTFQLNKSLIFFNRTVEELTMQDASQEDKAELREAMTEKFLQFLDEIFHTMRTSAQRQRMRDDADRERFPGDIIGQALIRQSLRLLAKHVAPAVNMKRHDYLAKNNGVLLELLNKHATRLDLGKEVC